MVDVVVIVPGVSIRNGSASVPLPWKTGVTVAPTVPGLTTLHLPLHAMGMAAAERLLAQIQHRAVFNEPVIMPVTLIARGSSGPAPTRARKPATRRGATA